MNVLLSSYTTLRIINAAASGLGLLLLVAAMIVLHKHMWLPVVFLWESAGGMLGAVCYANVSALIAHLPGGSRVWILTISLILLDLSAAWLLVASAKQKRMVRSMRAEMQIPIRGWQSVPEEQDTSSSRKESA